MEGNDNHIVSQAVIPKQDVMKPKIFEDDDDDDDDGNNS